MQKHEKKKKKNERKKKKRKEKKKKIISISNSVTVFAIYQSKVNTHEFSAATNAEDWAHIT